MTMIIVAALASLTAATFACRPTRRRRTPLDDILTLARLEQRGWRARMRALTQSGVPQNAGNVPMISGNWTSLLTPGLRKIWHTSMGSTEELFKRTQIFPVDSSVRRSETYQGIGELGTKMWNQFEDLGRVPYDGMNPVWDQELVHRRYAGGLQIERELMDDNLYPGAEIPKSITQRVAKLGRSAAIHREKSAAAVFNNAFTDTGTDAEGHPIAGPDAVGLVSTAHPHSASDSSTQSNEGTRALTSDNLVASKNAMREFTDDRGELLATHPDTLLVPPELEETAIKIVSGDLDPDSANNTINVNKGRYKVVVWDYLTDANAWFLIDSRLKAEHLVWLDRVLPEFAAEQDFDTLIGKWRGYYRFSRGWSDWRFVYGNNPS